MKKITIFVSLLATILAAAPTVAVLEFDAVDTEDKIARGVSELIRTELSGSEVFQVVERARLAQVLSEQALHASGLVDEASAVELGRIVGADYVIVGSVTRFSNSWTVAARFIEVETTEALTGVTETANAEWAIPKACREVASALADTAGVELAGRAGTLVEDETYSLGFRGTGQIVFHLGGDIHTLMLEKDEGRQLTNDGYSWQSVLSPNGRQVAFSSRRDGELELYTMTVEGTQVSRLTENDYIEDAPCWSPDGKRIAFHTVGDGNWEIYSFNRSGGDLQRLTNHAAEDSYPNWSPDGDSIVFQSNRGGGPDYKVYLIDDDGDNPRKLTTGKFPSWSPDGEQVAFVYNDDLYLIDSDGENLRRLTEDGGIKRFPRFTGDGMVIIFDDTRDIYAYDLLAGDIFRLTWTGCVVPSWGPVEE